jgi:hypothetical protein
LQVEQCAFRDLETLVPLAHQVGYGAQPVAARAQALLDACTLAARRLDRATEGVGGSSGPSPAGLGGWGDATAELEKAIHGAKAIPG